MGRPLWLPSPHHADETTSAPASPTRPPRQHQPRSATPGGSGPKSDTPPHAASASTTYEHPPTTPPSTTGVATTPLNRSTVFPRRTALAVGRVAQRSTRDKYGRGQVRASTCSLGQVARRRANAGAPFAGGYSRVVLCLLARGVAVVHDLYEVADPRHVQEEPHDVGRLDEGAPSRRPGGQPRQQRDSGGVHERAVPRVDIHRESGALGLGDRFSQVVGLCHIDLAGEHQPGALRIEEGVHRAREILTGELLARGTGMIVSWCSLTGRGRGGPVSVGHRASSQYACRT